MLTIKAPRIDQISMRIVKCSLPAIFQTLISNWKIGVITPIQKEGDYEKSNNNRPIPLLAIFSKVCEEIVINQMLPYLNSNKRLSTNQNGNKRFHSTETWLVETTD